MAYRVVCKSESSLNARATSFQFLQPAIQGSVSLSSGGGQGRGKQPMGSVCLGLLCGLPASGKSTLALQIQEHVTQVLPTRLCVLVLHYDRLIPAPLEQQLIAQTDEQGGSLWKSTRTQITTCVDHLLNVLKHGPKALTEIVNACETGDELPTASPNFPTTERQPSEHLVRPSVVDLALWERFVSLVRNSVQKSLWFGSGCEGGDLLRSWLVLVDDNMHYSSMRYQYCQLARKYDAGFCIIHVTCPLEEALQRNQSRLGDRVEDSVIIVMHERLETPDRDKRPWEKYFATVNGTSAVDVQPLLEMVQEALMDPQRLPPEEDAEEKVVSRYVCSTNTVHQADQILRRCLSLRMAEAKGSGLGSGELKSMSAEFTKIRTAILRDMRKGEVTLPFPLDEAEISDASKDTGSPLFQFVHNLFSARVNFGS